MEGPDKESGKGVRREGSSKRGQACGMMDVEGRNRFTYDGGRSAARRNRTTSPVTSPALLVAPTPHLSVVTAGVLGGALKDASSIARDFRTCVRGSRIRGALKISEPAKPSPPPPVTSRRLCGLRPGCAVHQENRSREVLVAVA